MTGDEMPVLNGRPGSRRAGLRRIGLRLLCTVPALLPAHHAAAQQGPQEGVQQGTSAAAPSVTVKGSRQGVDAAEFVGAENRVLSRQRASSCNFMSGYNPNEDELVLDYMRHFNHSVEGSGISNLAGAPVQVVRDTAPLGDAASASNAALGALANDLRAAAPDAMAPAVKCSPNDLRFAAGANRIARKDRTLAEGFAAYDRGDFPAAMAQFKENYRKLGYAISALMVGRLYLLGQGVPADTAQAITWLRKVVDARFGPQDRMRFEPRAPGFMSERAEAAMTLAKVYLVGHGVPKDAREARKWYEVASDAGYVPATSALALGYLSGFAGDRNPSKAAKYWKEAAEAGYVPAMYQLGKLYYRGDEGVPEDLKLAGAYFAAAAREGHPLAQYAAGRMYDLGESVPADQKRAIAYYKEAAVKGVADAQNALATYFYGGELVDRNLETARKLFNAAALQAQPDGMFNLAVMSAQGEGGPQDLPAAYVWYSLAKALGHAGAGAALEAIRPALSKDQLAKAEAILQPKTAQK
jgi:TPR repeat protein